MRYVTGFYRRFPGLWFFLLLFSGCFIVFAFTRREKDSADLLEGIQDSILVVNNDSAGDLTGLLNIYQSFISKYKRTGNLDSSAWYQNEVSRILLDMDSIERAAENLNSTKKFITTHLNNTNPNLAKWYYYSGLLEYIKEDFEKSLVYYDSALNYCSFILHIDNSFESDIYYKIKTTSFGGGNV